MYKCKDCGSTEEPYVCKTKLACRVCSKIKNAENHAKHKDRRNEISRQWRKDNPERNLELKKKWNKENPRKVRAMRRNYYASRTDEERKEISRKQRIRNKGRSIASGSSVRKAWCRAGDVTVEELRDIVERDGSRCVYCGHDVSGIKCHPSDPVGFDHVTPRSRGGKHTAGNLVVCCRGCNSKKHSGSIERLFESLEHYGIVTLDDKKREEIKEKLGVEV